MSVYLSVHWQHINVYSYSRLCAEMPLPTLAVPLLQKPIGSMLMMRGFMREKEGRVREWESHSGMKSEQRPHGYSLTCLWKISLFRSASKGWRTRQDSSIFLELVSTAKYMWVSICIPVSSCPSYFHGCCWTRDDCIRATAGSHHHAL